MCPVSCPPTHPTDLDGLADTLRACMPLELAIVFGSVARATAHSHSDLDIAVQARRPLTAAEKTSLIETLAQATGRPVDLIDLRTAGEPLLGQVLHHGKRLLGSNASYAALLKKHLLDEADFMPYRRRLLSERRAAWTAT